MFDEQKIAEIKAAEERWEQEHAAELKQERKENFAVDCGIPIRHLYTPADLAERGFDYLRDSGFPGDYPFVRGTRPGMYRQAYWGILEAASHATAEESNKLWKELVAAGTKVVFVQPDLPSQYGYDPDHPRASGEIGRTGLSITSLRDWEIVLDGIDVTKLALWQQFNALSAVGLANHIAMFRKQGADLKTIAGGVQNDILKDFIARGTYIFPLKHAIRQTVDVLAYAAELMPNYEPLQLNTYQMATKGANAVQEAAGGFANAIAYLEAAVGRGIEVDRVAPSISFTTTTEHDTFFEDIAKHRAMRRIWAKLMRDRFGAKKPRSMQFRAVTRSTGLFHYQQEYLNNFTRMALSVLSGTLTGLEWIANTPHDEAFGIPTVEAIRSAVQMQQVIAFETDIPDVVDPLAGSYFVESLTSEMEERILEELDNIEKHGGSLGCIESGYFQKQYAENSYKWQRAFERGDVVRVGVNRFATQHQTDESIRVYRADPTVEQRRREQVQELKKKRDNRKVERALSEVKAMAMLEASKENNIVPPIAEAVEAYATIGEIAAVLREVWGEYRGRGSSVF